MIHGRDLGLNCRWRSGLTWSALRTFSAAEPQIIPNGRSSIPRIRARDPIRPFEQSPVSGQVTKYSSRSSGLLTGKTSAFADIHGPDRLRQQCASELPLRTKSRRTSASCSDELHIRPTAAVPRYQDRLAAIPTISACAKRVGPFLH